MIEVNREILFQINDNSLRRVGQMKQAYTDNTNDCYFFPALQDVKDSGKKVDHISFHFTGQSHIKFTDNDKTLNTTRTTSIHQRDIGYFPFLAARVDPNILPIFDKSALSEADVVLDASPANKFLWLEISFTSTDFLFKNDLGFGTVLTDHNLIDSFIDREVLMFGNTEDTDHLLLYFAFGTLDHLSRPQEIQITTYPKQFLHSDLMKENTA